MSNKQIETDHKLFRDKIEKLVKRNLTKKIKSGKMTGQRSKGGVFTVPIKQIDTPHFVHGESDNGLSRGKVKEGDMIGKDDKAGKGNKAGDQDKDAIHVQVDEDYVLDLVMKELRLPRLKQKTQQFEDIKFRYNSLSLTGPESLRHNRKTWQQAMKRMASNGELDKLQKVPGFPVPIRLITPIQADKRFRQRREIKIPSNNAAIIFMRDGSGSVNEEKREIISNISWWAEKLIARQYKGKVQTAYIWHDNKAQEVDQNTWYELAEGGGTTVSSAFVLADELLNFRFPPHAWNVYLFYFTDGDNWTSDNDKLVEIIGQKFGPEVVNMLGVVQILSWDYENSVKKVIDTAVKERKLQPHYIRTISVGPENTPSNVGGGWTEPSFGADDDAKYEAIKKVFPKLFGDVDSETEMSEDD